MYRSISDFRAPEPIASDLRRLDRAISEALTAADSEHRARGTHRTIRASDYAQYDETLEVPNGVTLTISLPALSYGDVGREVSIIRQGTSGTVTLLGASSSDTVNGAASASLAGYTGMRTYRAGQTGWWQVGV